MVSSHPNDAHVSPDITRFPVLDLDEDKEAVKDAGTHDS